MKYVKSLEFLENDICRVILDDYTVLELDAFSVSASTVQPESEVEDEVIEELIAKTENLKAQKLATKFINTKMRTEMQLVKLLRQKGVSEDAAENTVLQMKEFGYIDDKAYARTFIEYRLEGSKKSFKAIAYELRLEGVSNDDINEVFAEFDTDEEKRAELVAEKVMKGRADEASVKKLSGILQRNGFGWSEISHIMKIYGKNDGEEY